VSTSFKSTCSYCGVGCGVEVNIDSNKKITVKGDDSHPSSKGMLCSKGMNLHYTVMDQSDRLLYPSMRYNRSMPMQRVTWDEALDRSAAIFKSMINKYGPDSVGFYVSGQCLTEEYYVINKLIKGFIGSNNIDTNSRLCMSSAVVGYKLTLGEDSVPVSYEDIEHADCFLVTGANPAWCHPIIWRRIEAHKEKNPEIKIIVVDPRVTDTASAADLHLQIRPGTDITLTNAIGRVLIENDAIDFDFITAHTTGFQAYKDMVFTKTIEEAATICDIDVADILLAAKYIKQSKGFMSLWTMGLNQSVVGVNKNLSLIDLHLITGRIGKEGNGPFSLTGQPNAMGGREVGGLANLLPAHRDLANENHRTEIQNFWKSGPINGKPGLSATEMFEALKEGKMKAIWIICTNPIVSLPDLAIVEEGLKNAKFVIVQDISNRSDTVAYADVVLPAAAWLEKEGTMTNSERRITYLPKVVDAPGEARPDTDIIVDFARKMGFGDAFPYNNCSEVYDEHVASTLGTNIEIKGLNYDILKDQRSVQWPLQVNEENGVKTVFQTKRLFADGQFFTADKKAKIHAVPDENLSESLTENFPLILTNGRIRDQWHTMTKTGKVNKLNLHLSTPYLEIHPDDAKERGITNGDIIIAKTRRGEVKVSATITPTIKKGVCFMPMHFGKIQNQTFGRVNNLTNPLYDARSKEPDFKFSALEVSKYSTENKKIVIIGAGSASLGFVSSYREKNLQDQIHVFSKEVYPFYNRIMLPDYISGHQSWDQLVRLREEQFKANNIVVHKGVEIVSIDRANKLITDHLGNTHTYDILLLGTGSKAFMPPNLPTMQGIFNMRSRMDADTLMPFISKPDSRAIIVGGGLLGLELAASLRLIGVQVTIVQRISRFMDRQLDLIGSEILDREIALRGIEVFYNDEISSYHGEETITGVRLKSGRKLECDALVFAIGTIPNVELAKQCGLEVKRGVVVNDYMQTSDPSIYAAGEIAQWRGEMWGITAAAEEQASVMAAHLAGDLAQYYKGSLSMNILKMEGLDLCSIGMIEIPSENYDAYEEILFYDKAKRYYKRCIIYQDRLVGAIMIGDKSEFKEFKDLIGGKIELSEKRLSLLRSGKPADPVLGKLVCSCNNVGRNNIINEINTGCEDFKALCQKTGAGTGCGSCRPEVKRILDETLALATT
jgi:ferredoxin-nitrate reductase